jgi:menaquinol-cytochrome c reductase iron-sulfur subunit
MANVSRPRRWFLAFCTEAMLGLIGVLCAVPVLRYLGSPLRKARGAVDTSLVDVGSVTELPQGEWRLLSLEITHRDGWETTSQAHAVWVKKTGPSERDFAVLSPLCPHLGCQIGWQAAQSRFLCPCHGGSFSASGKIESGPPPRSMDPLEFEVRNGRLLVRWQDFRIGVAQRDPVQS